MSPERVRRTLVRLACEIVERNRGAEDMVILGIRERGVLVAERLAEEIEAVADTTIPTYGLDVGPYRDDANDDADRSGSPVGVALDVTDKHVLLVDDVLFTGRTARAALDAVVQLGRPRSIQYVTLIDRGHREYPIHPDYVGRLIQTKHRERVEVAGDGTFTVSVVE